MEYAKSGFFACRIQDLFNSDAYYKGRREKLLPIEFEKAVYEIIKIL
jgi:hypothetical protein